MKIVFLSLLLLTSAYFVHAQQKPALSSMSAEQKADELVQTLSAKVSLTEQQLPQVKAVSLERVVKNTEAFKKIGPNDKARLSAASKMNLNEWEEKLKTILTAEQLATYMKP